MRLREFIWITVAVIFLFALVVGVFFPVRSYFSGEYICIHCGTKRDLNYKDFAGVKYAQQEALVDTPISQALRPYQHGACQHEWHLLRFGAGNSTLLRRGEEADGRSRFLYLRQLIIDVDFARELVKTPHPQQTWETICRAGQASPQKMDELMEDWYMNGPPREPFAKWWARNEARVKQLASAKPPATPPVP